ncbi:hypothetical protein TNCV_1519771 [Trichonephila clavipes]|nr:hypothetical protein TNCV_1519771 [Trichonephila clavipes]
MDEKIYGCFPKPMFREIYGRPKLREGSYDSVFEKPETREEKIEFDNGLGTDVWGWKLLNCVIPFRYEVTEEETPLYVTLFRNKKLYLKKGNHGNECLFQRMRDEMYILSRKQQNMMKEIKKVKRVGHGPKGDIKDQTQRDESEKLPDSK